MSDNFFLSYISDFLVNYFLDILHRLIITNVYLHFSSYFRQFKILSDINGCRTFRGPTVVCFSISIDKHMYMLCIQVSFKSLS